MSESELAPTRTWLDRLTAFCEMIKISHTVFALPFAIGAAFLAAAPAPIQLEALLKTVIAVLFARTAAMSFNRLVDRRFDAQNPRTQDRAIPAGVLSARFVALATVVSLAGFVLTAAWINPLALRLSPVVILVLLGYSYTKRFTALCHFVLGIALGLAPLGAWVVVRGELEGLPFFLALAVTLWVTGFDIIYACLDAEFDREAGLHSLPARWGLSKALRLAAALHFGMVACLVALGLFADLGYFYSGAVVLTAALLVYEHRLVSPEDLSRVQRAFFTLNGVVSVLLMTALYFES